MEHGSCNGVARLGRRAKSQTLQALQLQFMEEVGDGDSSDASDGYTPG